MSPSSVTECKMSAKGDFCDAWGHGFRLASLAWTSLVGPHPHTYLLYCTTPTQRIPRCRPARASILRLPPALATKQVQHHDPPAIIHHSGLQQQPSLRPPFF